jgi:transcription elongation factor GreA
MASSDHHDSDLKVEMGSWVKVQEEGMDDEETYQIGEVTRLQDNQIALDNPLGQALIGAAPGDEVTVEGPTGPIKLAVLGVGRADDDYQAQQPPNSASG